MGVMGVRVAVGVMGLFWGDSSGPSTYSRGA